MSEKKEKKRKPISKLHPRNRHRAPYNFKKLIAAYPPLFDFVLFNKYQNETIDFFNPQAVLALNTAIIFTYYDLDFWEIPDGYLCPSVPGRADYIHHIAELLGKNNMEKIPSGKQINCLDIGTGANCIYPIIGKKEYGWSFVGTDINETSIENCNNIITKNKSLQKIIEIRKQDNLKSIFEGIIEKEEYFDLTICNPPFHSSADEAKTGSIRKIKNLKKEKITNPVLNFGGKSNELWTVGGEVQFVENMIDESVDFSTSVFWFTSLISKQIILKKLIHKLEKVNAQKIITIPMAHGNKSSHILAWTFLSEKQQKIWKKGRWI